MVAQMAWIIIRRMATTPVTPCRSKVNPPAMSIIRLVPQVSQINPIQKNTRCQARSRPAVTADGRRLRVFANIGAVQLNHGYTLDQCKQAVEMVQADALILHLNALQEALQPEGDTRFAGLAKKIEQICRQIGVAVIAKEVGWGFSEADVRLLRDSGVSAIDVAGAGGTSWSQVEKFRMKDPRRARVAEAFRDWGVPTVEAIQIVRQVAPEMPVIASGGLQDGMDIAKSLALGARLGGMAGPFLRAARQSPGAVQDFIYELGETLRVTLFITGSRNLADLQNQKRIHQTEGGP